MPVGAPTVGSGTADVATPGSGTAGSYVSSYSSPDLLGRGDLKPDVVSQPAVAETLRTALGASAPASEVATSGGPLSPNSSSGSSIADAPTLGSDTAEVPTPGSGTANVPTLSDGVASAHVAGGSTDSDGSDGGGEDVEYDPFDDPMMGLDDRSLDGLGGFGSHSYD